ncbi:MAG: flagellar biosynthesis protein FlhF [Planctomycetota bacterium]
MSTIRTFTAKTMAEALALVKQELGKHAVVLHTRSTKQGGVLGIGARTLIEVTAADGRELARQRQQQAARSPRAEALRKAAAAKVRERSSVAVPNAADQQNAGDLIRRTYQAARTQFDASAVSETPEASQSYTPTVTTAAPMPTLEQNAKMADELDAVKRLVQQVVDSQKKTEVLAQSPPEAGLPDPLVEHYTALIQQEIACELANELIRGLDPDATDDVQQSLRDEIAKLLPTDPDAGEFKPTEDGRPRTIALVGPTGVGKTTTVAKLAATFKLKQNKRVGLITADTYRIAAVEQLRTYAGIIGLPLEVVGNPDELAAAIDRFSDMDVVLIDTAGRSQRNADRLDELAKLIETAQPHETHLVLSSTVSQRVLMETIDRFEPIKTDRLIFTKLDEAVTCGVLLNVAQKVNKPLSYITTGQEVPHQIEACSSGKLAEMVLGREVLA